MLKNEIKNKIIEVTNTGLTDKSDTHSYEEIYPELFEGFLDKEISILEIGVGKGGGLIILSEVFKKAKIYGVDYNYSGINPVVSELKNRGIILMPEMDQSDSKILNYVDSFDIIIEDASHQYTKSMESFNLLEPKLNKGGIYIIEDIYPEFVHFYKNDNRFEIIDLSSVKGRQDDVLAIYRK
jgi:cephalosporin hydroxylase